MSKLNKKKVVFSRPCSQKDCKWLQTYPHPVVLGQCALCGSCAGGLMHPKQLNLQPETALVQHPSRHEGKRLWLTVARKKQARGRQGGPDRPTPAPSGTAAGEGEREREGLKGDYSQAKKRAGERRVVKQGIRSQLFYSFSSVRARQSRCCL